MLKRFGCIVVALALAVAWLSAEPLLAQNAVLNEFYGSGVHNYYERDYFAAVTDLNTAIDGGSQDPRAYYYRGLARMRSGDSAGAHEDMKKGAALESADINQFYPVAKSLERVQGSERQTLERYRSLARRKPGSVNCVATRCAMSSAVAPRPRCCVPYRSDRHRRRWLRLA